MKQIPSPVQATNVAQPVQKKVQPIEYVTLQNSSESDPQHIFVIGEDGKGRRYSIPPNHVIPFPKDIANQFLQQCRNIRIFRQVRIPDSLPGAPKCWIANMTGNPALPTVVSATRVQHGEKLLVQVPNPIRIATTLKYKLQRSQETVKTDDGEETFNYPPDMLLLPPFSRVEIPANIALQLQNRDSMQDELCRGRLVRCRAPTNFEPNESWDYEDIRAYAIITAPQIFSVNKLAKTYPPASKCTDEELESNKWELLHELFFVLVNDNFNLPSQEQFFALKAAMPGEAS